MQPMAQPTWLLTHTVWRARRTRRRVGWQRLPYRNCLHRVDVAGQRQELGSQTVAGARPATLGQAVRRPDGEVLAIALIEEIHRRLPNTHQSWGVPVEEIQRGIRHGVRKINVDTDNRLAMTGAVRKVLAEAPDGFDPRDYLKAARAAMQEVCEARMTAFGQAGNAACVPSVTLQQMATRYGS